MVQSRLLIFDDAHGQWGPTTDLRAVFELRTGAVTTLQRIERVLSRPVQAVVAPSWLEAIVADRVAAPVRPDGLDQGDWLLVNGRWPGVAAAQRVRELVVGAALVQEDGQVVAAHLDREQAAQFLDGHSDRFPGSVDRHTLEQPVLLTRPWQILDQLEVTLAADLAACDLPTADAAQHGAVAFGGHTLRVAADAKVQPGVVFNTQQGDIVIDQGALVGAMSVLEGPCYIGPHSQVGCHAHIRPHTVIGPVCKVAGEISHSVIQGYSNKGHHGYLGHSLVGQWVNLGAATNVSNLKNTYGSVRVQLTHDEPPQDTGRMYQGPIIGDYVRTAIGSRLMTGSCLGTGSMIATSRYTPKYVDRFRFLTDERDADYDIEKFLATARTMMGRRQQALTPHEETRLRELHAGQVCEVKAQPSGPIGDGPWRDDQLVSSSGVVS